MMSFFFAFAIMGVCNVNPYSDTTGPANHKPGPSARDANDQAIVFSGYEWKVRNHTVAQGPGPNYFSEKSVWVDEKGFLHLYLHKDSLTGQWLCAEVTSAERFGYGTYSFAVEGGIDKFDRNIVLGLFNYSGKDGYDEMDIEFARWGDPASPNLNYTVWPAKLGEKNSSYKKEYLQQSAHSTQVFSRSRDTVMFSTFNGATIDSKNLVATWNCIQSPTTVSVSRLDMPVHINLWLFKGDAPDDNKPVEIIIHSFGFQKK